ncbi:hypothetical protein Ddye_025627 [Dipteronia dyeriana]|uniref:BHLH domain-containing protein n=1 Tax=Dipteronia dyeriana TaxID=168575 RepID=A0AAD9WPL6_9ROSI|nr:hypothetical protein Ddye_025627 [Dipteronia dyeriana]
MAGTGQEGLGDDFFEQILAVPPGYTSSGGGSGGELGSSSAVPMFLQLGSGGGGGGAGGLSMGMGMGMGMGMMPLGLNLEHSFLRQQEENNNNNNNASSPSSTTTSAINERDSVHMPSLFPAFGHLQSQSLRPTPPLRPPHLHQPFNSQPTQGMVATAPQPPTMRPRVRARRGQATDPHSIAERLRRERIAERMKALQELVPSCNKTDRAAMLDEIVDYVKFLRLQVKVLSMSRLGAAGAVAQLVADVPISSVEVVYLENLHFSLNYKWTQVVCMSFSTSKFFLVNNFLFDPSVIKGEDGIDGGANQPAWEKWSTDGTEQQVAKLMEEDIGAAMQFLQSKALCIMPISLASAIFQTHQPDTPIYIKPESNTPS